MTGQDTPKNWILLFGSDGGLGSAFEDTREIYRAARIKYLLAPPPGSPAYREFASLNHLHLGGKLRPASKEEERIVRDVRGMQHYIRGKFKSVTRRTTPTWVVLDNIRRGFPPPKDSTKYGLNGGSNDVWKNRIHIFNTAIDTMELPPVGDERV